MSFAAQRSLYDIRQMVGLVSHNIDDIERYEKKVSPEEMRLWEKLYNTLITLEKKVESRMSPEQTKEDIERVKNFSYKGIF